MTPLMIVGATLMICDKHPYIISHLFSFVVRHCITKRLNGSTMAQHRDPLERNGGQSGPSLVRRAHLCNTHHAMSCYCLRQAPALQNSDVSVAPRQDSVVDDRSLQD